MQVSWECENCDASGKIETNVYEKHKYIPGCCSSDYMIKLVNDAHKANSPDCDRKHLVFIFEIHECEHDDKC